MSGDGADSQEMEKHPFFMSGISEDQELSPLAAAFQSLKYDPEYNSPIELAKSHKDDGNQQFKLKKYKLAVAAYTEGLNVNSEDTELNAVLYSNRAAALYHMGSYRKALTDATTAKKLKPTHVKAIHRGALCCIKLEEYDNCILWCDEGLKINDNDKTFLDLKEKAADQLKRLEQFRLEAEAEQALLDGLNKAIKDRGINIEDGLTKTSIVCDYAGTCASVHITDDGELVWPVVLMYPQYGISEFIPNFNENASFYDYFCELFKDHADWDIKKEYTPDNLKVYFCEKRGDIVPVDMHNSLKSAMRHKRFQVLSGTLEFFVTCSEFDATYRSQNFVADV